MPKTRHTWTNEMEAMLAELYPASSWKEILTAFPGFTKTAIHQRAQKLGLSRWNQGRGLVGEVVVGTASEADIGWLAGFIDGEGTLQLSQKRRGNGAVFLGPLIRVVNNDFAAADKCLRLMGGYLYESRQGQWAVTLTGTVRVERVLLSLLPHLTVKAERARLLLKYAEVRRAKPGRSAYGAEEQAIYESFYFGSGRASASRTSRVQVGHYANAELNPGEIPVNV